MQARKVLLGVLSLYLVLLSLSYMIDIAESYLQKLYKK